MRLLLAVWRRVISSLNIYVAGWKLQKMHLLHAFVKIALSAYKRRVSCVSFILRPWARRQKAGEDPRDCIVGMPKTRGSGLLGGVNLFF